MDGLFAAFLREHAGDLDGYLGSFFCEQTDNDDVETYLYAPLKRYSDNAGKRHRPLICMLACRAVGGSMECARSAAAAIEHFQSAALIHDDIADKSELRRGEPCTYVTEGTGVAINIGDLGLVNVLALVLRDQKLPAATRTDVAERLVQMEERTLEGQALDLGWVRDGRWDISVEDYLYMASHKTAYYSAAVPLVTGALCGGGTPDQLRALDEFGMRAGLAFQLQDDLLNLVGDAEAQGKDFRSDITEGKRTLLMVWALAHLGDLQRDELLHILGRETTDAAELARAVELIDASGAVDYVRGYARELVADAKAHLVGARLEEVPRDVLLSMADFFVERAG